MSGELSEGATSRRRFVQICALGAAGAAGTAGVLSRTESGATPADDTALSSLQDDPAETVERLEQELDRRRQERRERLSSVSAETRRAAREVGVAALEGVVVLEPTAGSLGTAWAVDEDHLLTVAHTVDGAGPTANCWSLSGDSFEARIVGVDENQRPDVALLETDRDLSPLPTGTVDSLGMGDTLVQVGHPGHFGYWVLAAGPFHQQERPHAFASDVPILIGNSGSPVLNLDGEVVGISTSATISEEQAEAWGTPFRDETVLHEPVRPDVTTFHVPIDSALERMGDWT